MSWLGAIRFVGVIPLKQACVTVHGHLVIGGEPDGKPDANIQFVRCHNEAACVVGASASLGSIILERLFFIVRGRVVFWRGPPRGGWRLDHAIRLRDDQGQ